MAHFTGLKELQNHPHKAGFDIGSKNLFTAKVGELLPLYWDIAIPDCDYDISMLLHAKDTAKKIGAEGLRYLSESRRSKTSAIQSQLDQMDNQLLLDTVKSRHLQSPSEILAWSESLTQIAHELETRVGAEARKKYDEENLAATARASSSESSESAGSAE
jgi:hypothetical protein